MSRCDDTTFYRIFCITLLGTALAFTVVLTNVFLDIDGLLTKQAAKATQLEAVPENVEAETPRVETESILPFLSHDDAVPEDLEILYRAKRSLDSNNILFHVKNPKMKKALTNRLATLLQELDEEKTPRKMKTNRRTNANIDDIVKEQIITSEDVTVKPENYRVEANDEDIRKVDRKDMLHLAMHNVLLQGIIGHMDLSEVYKKVHQLVKNFDNLGRIKGTEDTYKTSGSNGNEKPKELIKIVTQDAYNEEDKFFEELINCEKLQKEIQRKSLALNNTDSPMLIKTVIEITNKKNINETNTNLNGDVKGIMKLIYNGQPIEFQQMSDRNNHHDNEHESQPTEVDNLDLNNHQNDKDKSRVIGSDEAVDITQLTARKHRKHPIIDQAIAEYLRGRTIKMKRSAGRNLHMKESYETKRLKRQIRIRYKDSGSTTPVKPKSDDDDLYVEIETHFDGKGDKGEKKKKLVRTLIDKIQKAINSDVEVLDKNRLAPKNIRFKKRTQDPIPKKNDANDVLAPVDNIEHRILNPISKTANIVQPLTSVLDKSGDTWKKLYNGPGFLTVAKSLNSAEMSELDIDYKSVMKNGIPKRLQKPLNTENDELIKPNDASDYGNVTLYMKDIDGSGFSIGLNQYTDEPPDKETLKMFTGLEDLIRTYHEHYDETVTSDESQADTNNNLMEENHEITRRDINKQIYDLNPLDLKRKMQQKRNAVNVKMISNIKSKKKLNKFLNTNARQTKKIFLKGKRNKRQVDKIRIVATDRQPRHSDENIFLISHENIFADRAIIKEVDTPEVEIGDRDDHYDFLAPYVRPYDIEPAYLTSMYDAKSMRSGLLSKYPHIIVENVAKSQEDYVFNPMETNFDQTEILETHKYHKSETETTREKADEAIERNASLPRVEEIVNAILPSRSNYKLTVKILPKNQTNLGPGFKEMHTTINKSFHKNGVRYVSSVNVSEISKVEALNKTMEIFTDKPVKSGDNEQQNKIKVLLELHKERIDQQLKHLQKESRTLNEMIGKENKDHRKKNITQLINLFRHLESKYADNEGSTEIPMLNIAENSRSSTTSPPLIAATNSPIPLDTIKSNEEKTEILNTIKQNENITKEILLKIDKNTDVLQSFLQKLSDRLQPVVATAPQTIARTNQDVETHVKSDVPIHKRHNKLINQFIDTLHTNDTKPIPFIYAFQQPISQRNEKPAKASANIVYHGHIHANNPQNDNTKIKSFWDGLLKQQSYENNSKLGLSSNETRFFIDELETDYKETSHVKDRAAPVVSGAAKINSTTI